MLKYNEFGFDAVDSNKDSQLSLGQYTRTPSNLSNVGSGHAPPNSYQAELPIPSNLV